MLFGYERHVRSRLVSRESRGDDFSAPEAGQSSVPSRAGRRGLNGVAVQKAPRRTSSYPFELPGSPVTGTHRYAPAHRREFETFFHQALNHQLLGPVNSLCWAIRQLMDYWLNTSDFSCGLSGSSVYRGVPANLRTATE